MVITGLLQISSKSDQVIFTCFHKSRNLGNQTINYKKFNDGNQNVHDQKGWKLCQEYGSTQLGMLVKLAFC